MFPSLYRWFTKLPTLALAFALTAGAAATHADPVNPLAAPRSAPATTPSERMTIEQIGQALDPYHKSTISVNENTYYTVNIDRGTWKFSLNVSLSASGNFIWIDAPLIDIADVSKASPVALAALLQKTTELGPSFFEIAGNSHKLQLETPIPNHAVTGEMLRDQIENMLGLIQSTHDLWKAEVIVPSGH